MSRFFTAAEIILKVVVVSLSPPFIAAMVAALMSSLIIALPLCGNRQT
jgi:hypothetical protein